MNKKGFLKALIFCVVVAVAIGFMTHNVTAQVLNTQIMLQSPLSVPIGDCSYLVDNFEYWCNPRNMGWQVMEPCYPTWGIGLGAAQLNNVNDFEEGSRVLDFYRPMSVFLFNTPYEYSIIQKATVQGADADPIPGAYSLVSFKLRAPLAIELFETFRFQVILKVWDSCNSEVVKNIVVEFMPREMVKNGCNVTGADSVTAKGDDIEEGDVISVAIGMEFQDSSWHLVMQDLEDIVAAFDPCATLDHDDAGILAVRVIGNQYRLDDIMFTKPACSIAKNGVPHLFRVGPVYAQMWNLADGRWIMAEDKDLMITMEIDDGKFVFPNVTDSVTGATYGTDLSDADPNLSEENLMLPVEPQDANLQFIFTMGDSLAPIANIAQPASVIPQDDPNGTEPYYNETQVAMMPPYLAQEDGVLVYNTYETDLSNPMYALAAALYNSGYKIFPNAVRLTPAMGQVFEDMILTCRVTDGISTDKETFPVSIVNFVVHNNPPLINDVYDQVFRVGQVNTYKILALDPDAQDNLPGMLHYRASLNGLPSYQYGPWMNQIIHPTQGIIAFKPVSEGALDCVVTVEDPRGMFAVCEFTIFCTNAGTWFNHPPIITDDLESPQTIRAGQMFVADEMRFVDPDGDKLYWSCNIGSVGADGIWTFQTMYPGYYLVQITAYDIRGGAATTEFVLHVLPWWSY